jgi:cytoskeletal protein CcmA (bactofilin family)
MQRLVPVSPLGEAPSTVPTARMLIVGRDIVISGEIESCDCLVVEGTVRANVTCNELRIAEGGRFLGSASVANADVVGSVEGELQISQRLFVRASGKISAKVRYRQIEIERGGQISGDIQALDARRPISVPAA